MNKLNKVSFTQTKVKKTNKKRMILEKNQDKNCDKYTKKIEDMAYVKL